MINLVKIQTVRGSISPDKLGITLSHEHILLTNQYLLEEEPKDPEKLKIWNAPFSVELLNTYKKLYGEDLGSANKYDMIFDDEELATKELLEYKKLGGNSLIEHSVWGLRLNVLGLKSISEKTDLNIIASTGCYMVKLHPKWIKKMNSDEIADIMIKEIKEGIENTQIKAGVIGECACSEVPYHPEEEKILRAACKAQKETGVGFTFHPILYNSDKTDIAKLGDVYLNLIEKEEANTQKFWLSHCDITCRDLDYHLKILNRGVTIAYDCFGMEGVRAKSFLGGHTIPSDIEKVNAIASLCNQGYDKQIIISHDIAIKRRLKSYGGEGYSHILESIIPMLKEKGITEKQIKNMLVENPKRLLSF